MIWIFFLAFILLDGVFNYIRIRRNGTVNHWVNTAYRTAIGVLFVWGYHLTGLYLLCFFIGGFCAFKFLFDMELNLLFHRSVFAVGTTAELDKLQTKVGLPSVFVMWCELVIGAGFIYGYFHTNLF